jgi:ATP-binding cassette, subfamily C, bacterial CydD
MPPVPPIASEGGLFKPPSFSSKSWLREQARPAAPLLSLAVALGLAAGMLLVIQAGMLASVVHDVIFEGQGLDDVFFLILALPALMVARAALVWAAEQFGFRAAAQVKDAMRMRLYDRLMAGPSRLRHRSTGDLAHQMVDAVEGLEAYYARFLPQAALAALIPLAVLAFVFPLDLVSGLILLFTAPFIPLFMVLIGSRAERLNQRQWRRLAALSARFLDSLQGLTTLKLFHATRREAEVIARITDNYRETTVSVLRVAFLSALILEFLATVSVALAAVLIGFKLLSGSMTFQTGFFILLLAPEFYLPLRALGTHYHARLSALAAAQGIVAEFTESPSQVKSGLSRSRWQSIALRLDNISFSHSPDRKTVHQISADIPAGSLAVLAGPSGTGKTTLLRILLQSLSPNDGRVMVNGADLGEVEHASWMDHVSWMSQEPFFFQGTVLDNVLMREEADLSGDMISRLDQAATLTGLDRDLAVLPLGWHTPVGEGGDGLSGGQRQRLALTRAVFKGGVLFLLDEPTAHLDGQSRETVLAALRSLAGRHTVIAASHDPRVLEIADKVVKLRNTGSDP